MVCLLYYNIINFFFSSPSVALFYKRIINHYELKIDWGFGVKPNRAHLFDWSMVIECCRFHDGDTRGDV